MENLREIIGIIIFKLIFLGKGGKNRRRGKNENETEKRELVFKEDGQGKNLRNDIMIYIYVLLFKFFELCLFFSKWYHMLIILSR